MTRSTYKKIKASLALISLSFFLSQCDSGQEESTALEENNTQQTISSGTSGKSSEPQSVQVSIEVSDSKGLSLTESASLTTLSKKCGDDEAKSIYEKDFILITGESCSFELKSFDLGSDRYIKENDSDKSDQKASYKSGEKVLNIQWSGDAQSFGNNSTDGTASTVGTSGITLTYTFSQVKTGDTAGADSEAILTTLEGDHDVENSGHNAPKYSLLASKDINENQDSKHSLESIRILLVGEHFGSSIDFYSCKDSSKSTGDFSTRPSDCKELTAIPKTSAELWDSSGNLTAWTDYLSSDEISDFAGGLEFKVDLDSTNYASSKTYIFAISSDGSDTSMSKFELKLGE